VAPELTLAGLPPEVRERILFFALPSAGRKNAIVCRADPATASNTLTASGKCLTYHKKECPGIVLVNKKISEESINLLQRTRNFGFCSAICLKSFLTTIHPDFARKISKISCKKVISEHRCEIHQIRPFADLVTDAHASMQTTLRPGNWRSVLTLDLMSPGRYAVATLMVQADPSDDQQSSEITSLEHVEVYDIDRLRKVFLGTFKISMNLDKEVLAARNLLASQLVGQAVATLAGVPLVNVNILTLQI